MGSNPFSSLEVLAHNDARVAKRLATVRDLGIEIDPATDEWIRGNTKNWSPALASAFAKKGGDAAAEKREAMKHLSNGDKARAFLSGESETAAKVLVDAMKDPNIPIKDRADIAKRVLEYAIGRPATQKAPEPGTPDEEGGDDTGISFTEREPDGG